MRRFLVFEDERRAFDALARNFAKEAAPSEEIELVWYIRSFDKPPLKTIYPATTEPGFEPSIVRIEHGNVYPPMPDRRAWWPSDFNGAILDIWLEAREEVGYQFAAWLEEAEFDGCIALMSKMGDRKNFEARKKTFIPKQGDREYPADPPWAAEVVRFARGEAAVVGTPAWQLANYRGRDPSRFMSTFYESIGSDDSRRWNCAVVGTDDELALGLSAFFGMSLDRGRALKLSELSHVLSHTLDDKRVIWVDCPNGVLTDELLAPVEAIINEQRGVSPYPITFFLAKHNHLTDTKARERMYRWNADIVFESLRDDHDRCVWAAKQVLALVEACTDMSRLGSRCQREKDAAALVVIKRLLAPLMMARSMNHIGGSKTDDVASLATWTSHKQGVGIGSGFRNEIRSAAIRLATARSNSESPSISESQKFLCYKYQRQKERAGVVDRSLLG